MTVSVTTHWDDLVEGYDAVMGSDPAYRRMLSTTVGLLPAEPRRILDLGSGTGMLSFLCSERYPEAEVIGIDPAKRMREEAMARLGPRPRVFMLEGSADDLSLFSDDSVDAVVSNFALHHLDQVGKERCAVEVFRVLRPGGRFVFADQHCRVMGPPGDRERVLDVLDILTRKARYYFLHASPRRMLLQLELLPRFIVEDGEILATAEFWIEALRASGFHSVTEVVIDPAEIMNRVMWAEKPVAA